MNLRDIMWSRKERPRFNSDYLWSSGIYKTTLSRYPNEVNLKKRKRMINTKFKTIVSLRAQRDWVGEI